MSETIQFDKKEYQELEDITKILGFKTVDEMVNTALNEFFKYVAIEREEVTVRIPNKLLALVKDHKKDKFGDYLSDLLTDSLSADVEAEVFGERDQIIEQYDMTTEFQFYQGH